MCGDWRTGIESCESSHGIIYRRCNYHCAFCNNSFHEKELYQEYSTDEFIARMLTLLSSSCHFKFSGGEQTLNPFLQEDLKIVKELGGLTFLDSNGSHPNIISNLIDEQLVDVLGISLKGLSENEALATSQVKKSQLCWQNVLDTIKIATQKASLRVIVTYVFYNSANIDTLDRFAKLIENYDNVVLKLNNLLYDHHHRENLKPIDNKYFISFVEDFLNRNKQWKGRTIVVNTEKAITNYDDIIFL